MVLVQRARDHFCAATKKSFNTKGKSPIDVCSTNYICLAHLPRNQPCRLHFIVPSACGGLICKTTSLLWKGGCSLVAGLSPGLVFDRNILDQKLDCVGGPRGRGSICSLEPRLSIPDFVLQLCFCSFCCSCYCFVVVVLVLLFLSLSSFVSFYFSRAVRQNFEWKFWIRG